MVRANLPYSFSHCKVRAQKHLPHNHLEISMNKRMIILALLAMPVMAVTTIPLQPAEAANASKLGDLSAMRKIVSDTLVLVNSGDTKGAIKRITEYESAWDKNAKRLRKLDSKTWTKLDEASDIALSTVRYPSATPAEMKTDLTSLIIVLDHPGL
jgi:hypothetical protein